MAAPNPGCTGITLEGACFAVISHLTQASLRQQVGVVLQEAYLFSDKGAARECRGMVVGSALRGGSICVSR